MPPTRVASNDTTAPATTGPRRPSPGRATSTAEPGILSAGDLHRADGGSVLALQRSAGNAAVASLVGSPAPIQRDVQIGEMTTNTSVDPSATLSPEIAAAIPAIIDAVRTQVAPGGGAAGGADDAGAAPTAAPTAPGDAAPSPVTSDGTSTTINGSTVTIAAPMTTTQGVFQADTVIAQNVIGSTYTPGAGNVM